MDGMKTTIFQFLIHILLQMMWSIPVNHILETGCNCLFRSRHHFSSKSLSNYMLLLHRIPD